MNGSGLNDSGMMDVLETNSFRFLKPARITQISGNTASRTTFQAELTLHAEKVSKAMSESDLTATVKSMLNAIGASDVVVSFSPTNTSGRTLLGANGVYADYTAVLSNGAKIRGRVHAVCVEKVLYTVHLAAPAEYWDLEGDVDYKDGVYDHLRKTMKITR